MQFNRTGLRTTGRKWRSSGSRPGGADSRVALTGRRTRRWQGAAGRVAVPYLGYSVKPGGTGGGACGRFEMSWQRATCSVSPPAVGVCSRMAITGPPAAERVRSPSPHPLSCTARHHPSPPVLHGIALRWRQPLSARSVPAHTARAAAADTPRTNSRSPGADPGKAALPADGDLGPAPPRTGPRRPALCVCMGVTAIRRRRTVDAAHLGRNVGYV